MTESLRDLRFPLLNQQTLIVLPFSYQDEPGRRAVAASPRWVVRRGDMSREEDAERTRYLVPYIRRFLFPEADPARSPKTACQRFDLDFSAAYLECKGVLRGADNMEALPVECRFEFARIELLLFGFNVGFLVYHIRSCENNPTFVDQSILTGTFRMLAPYILGQQLPVLTLGQAEITVPQLTSWLLAEAGGGSIQPLPMRPGPAAFPVGIFYDDRMMVYSFSCLSPELPELDLTTLDRGIRRLSVIPFDEESLEKSRIARGQNAEAWTACRWQGFSREGGTMVVFGVDEFQRTHLPNYYVTYYFDVFLFATLQRVALLHLNERLSDIPSLTEGTWTSRRVLRKLRHDLLLFRNQCCYSQITVRERGLQLWNRWLAVYDNDRLIAEVDIQSRELEMYFQGVSRERMEWVARIGGFLAAVFPAIFSLNAVFGEAPWVTHLKVILAGSVSVLSGLFALYILLRRPAFR